MEAFLVSTGLVAIAEIGDKTQLLAILLAARFRKPVPILLGIFAATIANHALAAGLGSVAGTFFDGPWMKWVLGVAFLAFAGWALIPDKFEEDEAPSTMKAGSVFLTTAVAFFFVEMGDKTQIATVALAARYPNLAAVVAGTTCGMVLANAPVIFFCSKFAEKIPLQYVRWTAAICFAALAVGAALY